MSTALIATGLTKRYRGRTVVDQLDFEVHPGEVVGLLGPNGAGKTTAFKLALGLVRPDAGQVRFGVALDGLPLYRRARMGLGYLPQGPSVLRGLSVRDNLMAVLKSLKKKRPEARTGELLSRFGLTHLSHQKAKVLSGGERRRLEFARALCLDPSILLCDEPFSGVDPIAVGQIVEAIEQLRRDGVGVLLTDHSVRDALSVCDRVYILVEGRVVDTGTADQIRRSDLARRVYLGSNLD